jgi:hypothetical protein
MKRPDKVCSVGLEDASRRASDLHAAPCRASVAAKCVFPSTSRLVYEPEDALDLS